MSCIALLTLRPSPDDAEEAARTAWTCLYPCGSESLRDAVLNVGLFVPLGFALALWMPFRRAILLCLLTTVAVEFAQYAWLLGRDASLRDILTNALGGGLGALLVTRWRDLLFPNRRLRGRLAVAAVISWTGIIVLTASLMRPALPESVYWGQWAPELGQFDTWRGTLLDARVGPLPMPHGRLGDSDPMRRALGADTVLVRARVRTGPRPGKVAPIASMFDSRQREIFVLGQRGNDLVFRIRTRARAVELGGPMVVLRDFPGHLPGSEGTVFGGVRGGALVVGAESAGEQREFRLPFSAGMLWTGLLPFAVLLGGSTVWLNAAWLALLAAPAGYWLAGGDTAPGRIVLLALAAGAAYLALGRLAGLPLPPWPEWGGSPSGILAGALAAWLLGARRSPRSPVPVD